MSSTTSAGGRWLTNIPPGYAEAVRAAVAESGQVVELVEAPMPGGPADPGMWSLRSAEADLTPFWRVMDRLAALKG